MPEPTQSSSVQPWQAGAAAGQMTPALPSTPATPASAATASLALDTTPVLGPDVAAPPLDDLFGAPVPSGYVGLSPRYRDMKHMLVLVVWGVELVIGVVLMGLLWKWWTAGVLAVVGLAWIAYRYWRVDRVYRAWGYLERATDLYVREGILMRRLEVVPYGRMQLVEVNSGPIERHYGLATVKLVTAAATTDATIPGLEAGAAQQLRDRLAELGEHQAAGL